MHRLIFRLYNGLLLLLLPLIVPFIALRWRRRVFSKGLARWDERWGHLPPKTTALLTSGRWWWVHAVSIGEAKAIEPFLREAPRLGVRVFLSLVTPEALQWAQEKRLAEAIVAAPIDLPWVVRRVTRAVKPEWFISVESEFWPNLLREAKRAGARVALVNGRISARSFRSYSRIRGLMSAVWACLDVWAVRQEEDAERFRALGVPPEKIHVTGNMKFDMPLPFVSRKSSDPQAPVIVLGSTREGEEEKLWPVMKRLRQRRPALQVIWAPRHVERCPQVEALLAKNGKMPGDKVWNTMGNLIDAYAQADIVVVGGSFVPKGGQNPLEPAALKRAVVFGPSMENFRGIADDLVHEKGAYQVNLDQLENRLEQLLREPAEREQAGERALAVLKKRQGATARTLALLTS